jgi:hypothetical protein
MPCAAPGSRQHLGLQTLAFEECSLGASSSVLLAGHRIPLALDDEFVHEARAQYLSAKALLLQQL